MEMYKSEQTERGTAYEDDGRVVGDGSGSKSMRPSCPKCQSSNIRRSRRRGLLELVAFTVTRVRPYRCLSCDSRFFRRAVPHTEGTSSIATTSHH